MGWNTVGLRSVLVRWVLEVHTNNWAKTGYCLDVILDVTFEDETV
jgi:hypothetical protein